ncbi:hypothetical protein PACTADRAFT_49768 [Pachysolen tannophilus NRRL Y-2460]|uniref:Presequence translocated-associated motor subunit PAM17 n=1 Tax=Pachysolen tannophilus NRRL Y-2460 TaxID=669874 RepID=A0A1E4TXE4_PACTA|nr:hypothetical protein PACTADRAFT_49768 [Pachysolen tannophilus NRRL Y-2460]
MLKLVGFNNINRIVCNSKIPLINVIKFQSRTFHSFKPLYSSSSETEKQPVLSWEEFLKLRKQERRINLGSSIFTALFGSTLSWGYISQIEIDPTEMILGFDPFMVMVLGMMSCTGLGYLLGPFVGGGIFNIKNKKILDQYMLKQKSFLNHVIKNRVDASRQSFSNPVPDYYGERIGSLKEYRQWLRDCNAYRKKAQEFL